jgi:hypothetical protein
MRQRTRMILIMVCIDTREIFHSEIELKNFPRWPVSIFSKLRDLYQPRSLDTICFSWSVYVFT